MLSTLNVEVHVGPERLTDGGIPAAFDSEPAKPKIVCSLQMLAP